MKNGKVITITTIIYVCVTFCSYMFFKSRSLDDEDYQEMVQRLRTAEQEQRSREAEETNIQPVRLVLSVGGELTNISVQPGESLHVIMDDAYTYLRTEYYGKGFNEPRIFAKKE